jgi:hypothetical protein
MVVLPLLLSGDCGATVNPGANQGARWTTSRRSKQKRLSANDRPATSSSRPFEGHFGLSCRDSRSRWASRRRCRNCRCCPQPGAGFVVGHAHNGSAERAFVVGHAHNGSAERAFVVGHAHNGSAERAFRSLWDRPQLVGVRGPWSII